MQNLVKKMLLRRLNMCWEICQCFEQNIDDSNVMHHVVGLDVSEVSGMKFKQKLRNNLTPVG